MTTEGDFLSSRLLLDLAPRVNVLTLCARHPVGRGPFHDRLVAAR
ncbi:MAG TPA: hypothetical protein VEP49_04650 [Acidimicrobiia bacterium]|nr:hypothetical protein [Acidimicrobiia bacterium]